MTCAGVEPRLAEQSQTNSLQGFLPQLLKQMFGNTDAKRDFDLKAKKLSFNILVCVCVHFFSVFSGGFLCAWNEGCRSTC